MNETGTQHYTPQWFQSPSYLQSTDSKLVTQIYLCCLDAGVVGNTQNIITDQVKGCVLARGSLISHGVGKVQGHISICIKVSPYKHQMSTYCTCTCLWTVLNHTCIFLFLYTNKNSVAPWTVLNHTCIFLFLYTNKNSVAPNLKKNHRNVTYSWPHRESDRILYSPFHQWL